MKKQILRITFVVALCISSGSFLFADQKQKFISKYTNLTKCKVLIEPGEPDEGGPNDGYLARCPGREGYTIYNEGGDSRDWLVIVKDEKVIDLQGLGSGELMFPGVAGNKLEWRYQISEGKPKLVALIFRMGGGEYEAHEKNGNSDKPASFLYVVQLNPENYCVMKAAKTNEEARQLSDGDSKPNFCRKYNESKWTPTIP